MTNEEFSLKKFIFIIFSLNIWLISEAVPNKIDINHPIESYGERRGTDVNCRQKCEEANPNEPCIYDPNCPGFGCDALDIPDCSTF